MPSPVSEASPRPSPWLVDAHAHLHERYDLDLALDAAEKSAGPHRKALLLLADVSPQSSIERLSREPLRRWRIEPLEGGLSCRASNDTHGVVSLVAGRQIVTRERLELLTLGWHEEVAPNPEIRELIERANQHAALAVLPWGFGKWTGRRGRIVQELLSEFSPARLCLGDNAGRAGRARPKMFQLAEQRGFRVLPGSDPLPLPHQERRVGAYGFEILDGDPDRPWSSLRQAMDSPGFVPPPSGNRVTWPTFAWQQTSMLLRKHVFSR